LRVAVPMATYQDQMRKVPRVVDDRETPTNLIEYFRSRRNPILLVLIGTI
jgi:hypothetical protein